MALAIESKLKMVAITMEKDQVRYLKKKGINRSKFVRQAVEAHKEGKFDYQFLELDE